MPDFQSQDTRSEWCVKPRSHWASLLETRRWVYSLLLNSLNVITLSTLLTTCSASASEAEGWATLLATCWLVKSPCVIYLASKIPALVVIEMSTVVVYAGIVVVAPTLHQEVAKKWKNRKSIKVWVTNWVARWEIYGASNILSQQLKDEDPIGYRNILRMYGAQFDALL